MESDKVAEVIHGVTELTLGKLVRLNVWTMEVLALVLTATMANAPELVLLKALMNAPPVLVASIR